MVEKLLPVLFKVFKISPNKKLKAGRDRPVAMPPRVPNDI